MIKAIVFDCFGVLASDGLLPFRQKYFGNDPVQMQKSIDNGRRVDAGLASYDEFIAEQARMAGIGEPEARDAIENNVPDSELFEYIRTELHGRYKLGFLSNAGDNWLSQIFIADQISLFDAIVLSYETGFIKPDPHAYQAIAEKLACKTSECLMVDDQQKYVDGARSSGMEALVYSSCRKLKADMQALGSIND